MKLRYYVAVKVTNGDEIFLLSQDESTYIPVGVVHVLGNTGKVDLELIGVQPGSSLGEDDIVRLDEIYGRNNCKNSFNVKL